MIEEFKQFLKEHQCYKEFCYLLKLHKNQNLETYCNQQIIFHYISNAFPQIDNFWKALTLEWYNKVEELKKIKLYTFLVQNNVLFEFIEYHNGATITEIVKSNNFYYIFAGLFKKEKIFTNLSRKWQKEVNAWTL